LGLRFSANARGPSIKSFDLNSFFIAEKWAAEIMECSPLSVQATKEAAYMGLHLPLEEAVDKNFPAMKKLFKSQDLIEGPRAFAEKRKPNWKGE